MNYFLIKPGGTDHAGSDRFQGALAHRWFLPGVECPVCEETWATRGVHYPTVDLSSLSNAADYARASAVNLQEFKRLQAPLVTLMPDGSFPPPGTRFGPLHGSASGTCGSFAWPNLWTPLVRREVLSQLASVGINIAGVAVTYEGGSGPELFEPQILPRAYLAPGTGIREIEPCPGCGRRGFSKPKNRPLILDASSIHSELDIFRIIDLPTFIVVSDRFHELAHTQRFTGLTFHPIDIS